MPRRRNPTCNDFLSCTASTTMQDFLAAYREWFVKMLTDIGKEKGKVA